MSDRLSQFHGQNGKFDGGRKVHTVGTQLWIDGQHVAAPACRTGSASFDPDVFQPTGEDVDCDKCLALPNKPALAAPDVNQLPLALDSDQLDELIAQSSVGDGAGQQLTLRASPSRVEPRRRPDAANIHRAGSGSRMTHPLRLSEADFQRRVISYAKLRGGSRPPASTAGSGVLPTGR